jgi:hypothetical protein
MDDHVTSEEVARDQAPDDAPPFAQETIDAYLRTPVDVVIDGDWVPVQDAVTRIGEPLHVLTAWNPGEERPGAVANRAANERLAAAVDEAGGRRWAAMGVAPDDSWFEEGYAVTGLDRATAVRIARDARQVAIFEATPEEMWLVFCFGDLEPIARTWSERA